MGTQTWSEWKDAVWTSMEQRFGYPGLAPLEQYMIRSKKERRCVECGDLGTVQHGSMIVKSVSHYFMCADCDLYWKNKG